MISPPRIGDPSGRNLPISKPMPALLLAYLAIISPEANIESKSSSLRIRTQLLNCLVGVPRPASTGVAKVNNPSDAAV